jgi:hypothetical protein
MSTPYNLRAWREWSDGEPPYCPPDCVEGEYVDQSGRVCVVPIRHYFYADEPRWGFSTGDWRDGTSDTHHPKFHRWRYRGTLVPSPEAQGRAILVWEWSDAPGELRARSPHGGDEDYVGLLPKDMDLPSWMDTGSAFGCCSVSEHPLEDGRRVFIGAHA